MERHRSHSVAFKCQVAQEYLSGETPHGLTKRHDPSRNLVRVWVQKYETGAFDDDAATADANRIRHRASSSLVAARNLFDAINFAPTPRRPELLGKAIHIATGIGWGAGLRPGATVRRSTRPFTAALICGTDMSLILDKHLLPALGLSALNHQYPTATRIRGLIAHLVNRSVVAIAAEGRPARRP